jgi:lactate dehydrogenase-like 2-hydroxyacid dehydrogenase
LKILIPDVITPPVDIEREIFGSAANVITGGATHSEMISDKIWEECSVVLAFDQLDYNKELLSKMNSCKVIVRVGVGYDNVDIVEAKNQNIVVCNVPDYGTEEVADHTMALLLSLVRGLPEYTRKVKLRDWNRHNSMPFRLRDKVIGIIGLGRIGTATALRSKSFGMKVIFYDPYINDGYDKALGVERVRSLEQIAKESDIITLHTPLTHETKGMINDSFFAYVNKGPIIINTARGPIIDIAALGKAMREGVVKAAGLDVLPIEPSDDSQQLIVDWENDEEWLKGRLLVTPHVSFCCPEAFEEMRRKAAVEALRVLNGEKAINCVNSFYE